MTASHDAVHCLVMAKAPEPGSTKTRLAATVGPKLAAELSAAALLDTLHACRGAFGLGRCHVSLAGSLERADDAERIRAALSGWQVRPQEGDDFADRLARAISGRGAFRRFKDRLSERPVLMTRWHAFSADRQRGRARSWLAAEGYTPVPRRG